MMSFSFSTSLSSTFPSVVLIIALFFALLFTTTTTAETITVDNWYIPYKGQKELTANVGDTITFEWNTVPSTAHNVFIHPTMDCELDGAFFVGDVSPTSYTFTATDAGTEMFFACNIGGGSHCNNGQNLIVTVSAAGNGGDDGSSSSSSSSGNDSTTAAASPTSTPTVKEEPGCDSICNPVGGEGSNLKNPNMVVEYNWNPRVPTCSSNIGSCETDTCVALERKLRSFNALDNKDECNIHQLGLQSAGCECDNKGSSSSGSASGSSIFNTNGIGIDPRTLMVSALLILVAAGAN